MRFVLIAVVTCALLGAQESRPESRPASQPPLRIYGRDGVAWQRGDLDAAVKAVERLVNRQPFRRRELGLLHERRGDWRKALDEWKAAPDLDWASPGERTFGMARCEFQLGHVDGNDDDAHADAVTTAIAQIEYDTTAAASRSAK